MSLQRWFLLVGWICVATIFCLAGYREHSKQVQFNLTQATRQEMKELLIRLRSRTRPAEFHGKLSDSPLLANKLVIGLYPDSLDAWGTEYDLDIRYIATEKYPGVTAAVLITICSAGPNQKREPGDGDDMEESKTCFW